MRLRKFWISLTLTGLGFSGLLVAPTAQAVTAEPSIAISDYTPVADQLVYLFMEDLEPNTEYSFGYMFAVDETLLPYDAEWVAAIGSLGDFTTDDEGSAIESLNWYWQVNEEYDVYTGVFPTYIYVNELGEIPNNTSDVIAKTRIIYPGQNIDLGTVTLSGDGVGDEGFLPGFEASVTFNNFGSQYSTFEPLIFPETNYEKATDIWTQFFNNLVEESWLDMGDFDDNGDASVTVTIPPSGTTKYMLVQLYNNDMDDHSATWFVVDYLGNIQPFVDLEGIFEVPNSVRPYTYLQVFDENDRPELLLNVDSELSCTSIGGYLLFYASGPCDWSLLDENEEVQFGGRVTVSKSAALNAATSLEHRTLNFKKGSIVVSRAAIKTIRSVARNFEGQSVLLNGYAWVEGTVKQMKRLSGKRALRVSDFFDYYEMSTWLTVGFGKQKPLYVSGKKQSQNRRVEIIVVPSEII